MKISRISPTLPDLGLYKQMYLRFWPIFERFYTKTENWYIFSQVSNAHPDQTRPNHDMKVVFLDMPECLLMAKGKKSHRF